MPRLHAPKTYRGEKSTGSRNLAKPLPASARIHRAVADPASASPEELIQLQRQYGNRAVQRLIQRAQTKPPGDSPQRGGVPGGTGAAAIQRKFGFTFTADVGLKARTFGKFKAGIGKDEDHNTAFSHIMDAYKKYENAGDIEHELACLHTMIALCKNYIETYADKNYKKTFSAQDLLARCEKELPNTNYMARFAFLPSGVKGVQNATRDQLISSHSDLVDLRNDKAAFEEKLAIKAEFFGQDVADMILLYADLLSPAERAAITRYTDQQYKFINPALADNAGWMRAMVNSYNDEQDRARARGNSAEPLPPEVAADLDQTMADNRAIGEMATSALGKLPSWQKGPVFRGETFPAAEGKALRKAGATKRWPHLVSTSKNEGVSGEFAKKATDERPIGVLFKFEKHLNGKDIKPLSAVASEDEVLFAPHTTVQVKKMLKKQPLGAAKQYVELEVEEVGAPARPTSRPRSGSRP